MLQVGPYVFKRAETSPEFEGIHRLNYRTFVGEIPQHADNGSGRLVDKFHDKSTYFIALHQGQVVAMISVHDRPPFSVASRLSDPGVLERPGTRPLEVRLLAVEPGLRNGNVTVGLLYEFYEYARAQGYTHLFISGVVDQIAFYERLGFTALGPAVPSGGTAFVPMAVTLGELQSRLEKFLGLWRKYIQRHEAANGEPTCLLPGPVATAAAVRTAYHLPPLYHRGPEFISLFQKVRRTLGELAGARDVALLNGSGTLANEVIAATLAADGGRDDGLVLVNGEFGQRLARQAGRHGLRPRVLNWDWGKPWDLSEVETALGRMRPGGWVWGVHLETSTGVLNHLPGLVGLARPRGIRVCCDCISSLGSVPLDLSGVSLASGATGKSLGAFAGIALVFASADRLANLDLGRVPSYLDLRAALTNKGPCFTFPSPPLRALEAALAEYATPEKAAARYERYAALGAFVRAHLREMRLPPLAADADACPVIATFTPPGNDSAEAFVQRCLGWGFAIGGQSGYLAERRLVQISTMGAVSREDCAALFEHLREFCGSPLAA